MISKSNGLNREITFFLEMKIPGTTHQEKKVTVRNGKPIVYEPSELKDARAKYMAHLAAHVPVEPLQGPIQLKTAWIYPTDETHASGDPKLTKPDTDNLIKLFKDCMTKSGFWKDDAQVYNELTIKVYGDHPGILVSVVNGIN